jgi:hypothetical protein
VVTTQFCHLSEKNFSGHGGDELLARIGNYEICKAAFEKALFLYPNEHLEMRQGARVILKSGSGSTGWASSAGVSHGR